MQSSQNALMLPVLRANDESPNINDKSDKNISWIMTSQQISKSKKFQKEEEKDLVGVVE